MTQPSDLPRRQRVAAYAVIVRGEGEATVVALVEALAGRRSSSAAVGEPEELAGVAGIAWRDGRDIVVNPARAPIADLDAYPIGWDLIEDWDRYRAFGLGRAAVVQFSRGCPHTCTYCLFHNANSDVERG